MTEQQPPARPGLISVIKSVLASFFGVQSERNRRRDFQAGSPMQYIIVGLAATLVFVLVMWTVVRLILSAAAA